MGRIIFLQPPKPLLSRRGVKAILYHLGWVVVLGAQSQTVSILIALCRSPSCSARPDRKEESTVDRNRVYVRRSIISALHKNAARDDDLHRLAFGGRPHFFVIR
jgi:hypothetical protein